MAAERLPAKTLMDRHHAITKNMPGCRTVTPEAITDTLVTVRCPRCEDLHQYHVEALKPWPITPGSERIVSARCLDTLLGRAAEGHREASQALTRAPRGAQ